MKIRWSLAPERRKKGRMSTKHLVDGLKDQECVRVGLYKSRIWESKGIHRRLKRHCSPRFDCDEVGTKRARVSGVMSSISPWQTVVPGRSSSRCETNYYALYNHLNLVILYGGVVNPQSSLLMRNHPNP
jgi:hypothetical protein